MAFFIVGFILWVLIVVAAACLLLGLWKKSWKYLMSSGLALFIPSLYFWGAENWFKLIALLPWLVFLLAYYMYKKKKR